MIKNFDDSYVKIGDVEYKQVEPIPKLNLPELEELECITPVDDEGSEYIFRCKAKSSYRGGCPQCGCLNYYSHGYAKPRLIHDRNMGLTKVFMEVETRRYKCNECGATFNHIYNDIMRKTKYTKRLYRQIQKRAMKEPFKNVAQDYDISIPTVQSMMLEYGKELEEKRGTIVAPRVLGVDEKHIENDMCAVFVDVETGEFLEMIDNNKKQSIVDTIYSMKDFDKIEMVTIDMNNSYRPAIEEALPWAKIIVDKWHVLAALKRKVQETKTLVTAHLKAELKAMPDDNEKFKKQELLVEMGKNNWLFKFGIKKLSQNCETAILMLNLCDEFPEIKTLKILKEGVERIYYSKSREQAEKRFYEWEKVLRKADKELFKPMVSMHGTLTRWHEEIFGYFDKGCQFTNALAEGKNSLVQAVNTQGRGYGFKVLRYKSIFFKSPDLKPKKFSQSNRIFSKKKNVS